MVTFYSPNQNKIMHTSHCPHCHKIINAASLLGAVKSEAKKQAARENGKKGGRPKKDQTNVKPTKS